MDTYIKASTASDLRAEIVRFYEREAGRLAICAGRSAGRDRRDYEAIARYASHQAAFWRDAVLDGA